MVRSNVFRGVVAAISILAAACSAVRGDEPATPAAKPAGPAIKPEGNAKPAAPTFENKTVENKAGANKPSVKWAPAVTPKPLSKQVKQGLKWLAEHQLKNGSWGQGEESAQMGGGKMKDIPSVADTSMAALALIRAGNTPTQDEYAKNVLHAVEYVCGEIEESSKDSLEVTNTRGTRVQTKLGPYIDTFSAAAVLPDVKDQMPDEAGKKRVAAALDKLLAKIQKNQRPDGTWAGQGWATTLQQNMAVRGLNKAAQSGAKVDEKVRENAESQARQSFDKATGKFSKEGSAGVELYSAAGNLSNITQNATTNALKESEVRAQASSAPTPAARQEAKRTIARFDAVKKDQSAAEQAVIARLDDKQFLAGFGSNGGEEFLSYMNIGESLVVKGGDSWKAWDKSISENLDRVQNSDGSWSGHHCITGRTFCTSAALLVLMVDRSPQPISDKMKRR
jgi:hypothetical protein